MVSYICITPVLTNLVRQQIIHDSFAHNMTNNASVPAHVEKSVIKQKRILAKCI